MRAGAPDGVFFFFFTCPHLLKHQWYRTIGKFHLDTGIQSVIGILTKILQKCMKGIFYVYAACPQTQCCISLIRKRLDCLLDEHNKQNHVILIYYTTSLLCSLTTRL